MHVPSRARRRPGRADAISQQLFGRPVGQIASTDESLTVTPDRRPPIDREVLYHFWHPDRLGVEQAPPEFARQLAAVHRDLAVVRPPARAPLPIVCWLLWYRKPTVTHALCPGWWLLLRWAWGRRPLALDEKLLAAIYHFDARQFTNGQQYFNRLMAERDRRKQIADKDYRNDRLAQQQEWRRSLQISSAGRGSRFALHHDGTILPSRGELAWTLERAKHALPSEQLREQRDRS